MNKSQSVSNLFELVSAPSDNYVISASHTSKLSGITHTYIRQAINNIGIRGTESSLHYDKGGNPLLSHNKFIEKLDGKLKNNVRTINAEEAIEAASRELNLRMGSLQLMEEVTGIEQKSIFRHVTNNDEIPVELAYIHKSNDGGVYLTWEVIIQDVDTSDWWLAYVNASDGSLIEKHNLTLSCFEEDHNDKFHLNQPNSDVELFYTVENAPSVMVGSYNVFPLPVESPNHGSRSIVTDPDNPVASPFGWHDTNGAAGAEFTITRGNNTHAYEDGDNAGFSPDGTAALIFDFPFNPIYSGGNQSESAALTNLFYWANIIHDVTYQYGFDEVAGNFQENNYGNGGIGSDSVNSEAQDGSGTCNANFGTPPDGNNPTMQMYVCGSRDGDVDNGVIIHEYGHGISNRLTGGPAASGCLGNSEQMGEGWSDYYGLMLTMESGDAASDARGIGTWLFGQGANGPGIRTYPYSTDFAVNQHTYDDIKTESVPHGVGSVWCAMLWEMTWELIDDHGFSTDLYTVTGNPAVDAGNVQALALVTEAMKLQPCSPGFIDGRDAILLADQTIYGGANQCAIWDAFARRGLGYSADQGLSTSRADGSEAFDLPPGTANFSITQSTLCITEGIQTGLGGGLPTGGVYSGSGVTDDGNGTTFSFDPSIAGLGEATITYTVTDTCTGGIVNLDQTIMVKDGIPEIMCQDLSYTLDASGSLTIDPFFNQATIVGGDNGSGNPGFTILIVTPTQDATISFDWSYSTTDGPQWDSFGYVLDTTYYALSNTSSTSQSGSFSIDLVSGVPFGFCVFSQDNTFGPATGVITNFSPGFMGQFEAANFTEILQESDGTTSVDAVNLLALTDSCGSVTLGGQMTFDCSDVGTQSQEYIVTDTVSGLSNSCFPTITINPHPSQLTTFGGGSWDNGAPTNSSVAVFNGDYNTGTDGNVDACSCEISTGNTVTVEADNYLNVEGNITVDGTLIVEHQGSIVQIDDDAVVTNNGSIEVRTTSPNLESRDFMILGSPMSNEAREDVWSSAFLVLNHDTSLFFPNAEVEATLEGAENFADDNYDNWIEYATGPLNVGEGYLVRPQAGYGEPGGIFNYQYNSGTLNNGVIAFPVVYNNIGTPTENRNASPNIISNPYASPIFAEDFISQNAMVDAVYFWEHLTPPSPDIPGAGAMNFDMQDISYYNMSGGVEAGNDQGTSTRPNGYISTSQGFAIKASSGGNIIFNNSMRRTTGNNTLRNPSDRDRLWIKVTQSEYELQCTSLIAFSEETTVGIDMGYDATRLATILSLYTHLEDGSAQLGIQSREALTSNKEVPVGFSTLMEGFFTYKISMELFEGENLEVSNVYLVDNLTGTFTDLKENSYSFTSGPGVFHNRFTLIFNREKLSVSDNELADVILLPNPTNGLVSIFSPRTLIKQVIITDIHGRTINSLNINDDRLNIDLSSYASSVYFVSIICEEGSITKKIIKR